MWLLLIVTAFLHASQTEELKSMEWREEVLTDQLIGKI